MGDDVVGGGMMEQVEGTEPLQTYKLSKDARNAVTVFSTVRMETGDCWQDYAMHDSCR